MRLSDYVYYPCVVIKNKVKHDTIFTQLLKRVILVKSQNVFFSCILKFHQKKSAWEKVCNLNGKKMCTYIPYELALLTLSFALLANPHPEKASPSAFFLLLLFFSWAASYCWSTSEIGVDRLFYKSVLFNLHPTSLVFSNPFIIAYDSQEYSTWLLFLRPQFGPTPQS